MSENYQIITIDSEESEVLHATCSSVEKIDESVLYVLNKMVAIMVTNNGIGLAANQIGVDKRLVVMLHRGKPLKLVNPKIVGNSRKMVKSKEGCLSLPGREEEVMRFKEVDVAFLSETGFSMKRNFKGLEAFCIQHEIDHLNGKTLLDDETYMDGTDVKE